MRAVERNVVFQCELQLPMQYAGDRLQSRPEQTMMHQQKIDIFLGGLSQNARGDIHRRANFCDAAGVFGLQSIQRVWPVFDLANAQIFAGVFNYFGERRHCNSLRRDAKICTSVSRIVGQVSNLPLF